MFTTCFNISRYCLVSTQNFLRLVTNSDCLAVQH